MNSDKFKLACFDKYIKQIDDNLQDSFSSGVLRIEEIGRYSLLGEGKRIRPLLFVLSGLMCGYQEDDIYYLSTMFEYIHCASLLHDDVIDQANTRRNRPSASNLWGNSAAVLTGDYLSSCAIKVAVSSENMELIRLCGRTVARMTEGQFLELIHAGNWNTTKDQYIQIIKKKTAELMAFSCASGAVISNAEEKAVDALNNFGINLGIAFQMTDDLLDYVLTEEEFGKPVGKDLREGKVTLPLIYTLADMERDESDRFVRIFKNSRISDEDINELISRVRNSGNIEKIRSEAENYISKASEFLKDFPESYLKEELLALNKYIALRRF